MRPISVALFALVALAAGCGAEPAPAPDMAFSAPSFLPLSSCPNRAAIGASMQAVLEIGGHEPCPLTVDPSTLAVSGVCEPITKGIVRPIGLGYWLPNPSNSELAALAYIVSWVDLRKDALGDSATETSLDLTPDGIRAEILTTNADVAGLAADDTECAALTDPTEVLMCNAEVYFTNYFVNLQPINFDIDTPADGVPNIVEACNNTLF